MFISNLYAQDKPQIAYAFASITTNEQTTFITDVFEFDISIIEKNNTAQYLKVIALNNHKLYVKYLVNNYKIRLNNDFPNSIVIETNKELVNDRFIQSKKLAGSNLVEISDFIFETQNNSKPNKLIKD